MQSDGTEQADAMEDASYRELRMLEEVGSTSELTQRSLASRLGIALGVANLLVRSLGKKGYVRATKVGWRRWAYVLTPAGVARRVQLTLTYADRFVGHYRRVRLLVRQDLEGQVISPDSRVAIYGTTELAELMYLALRDIGVTRIEFFGRAADGTRFLGMPITDIDDVAPGEYVKVMVAFATDIEGRCHELQSAGFDPTQFVTLLGGSANGPAGRSAAGGDGS